MKKIKTQLKNVSKSLLTLSKQVENVLVHIEKELMIKNKSNKEIGLSSRNKLVISHSNTGASTLLDAVYEVIKRSRKGITISKIKEMTALENRQVSNALYKLTKKGKIQTKERGVYIKKS